MLTPSMDGIAARYSKNDQAFPSAGPRILCRSSGRERSKRAASSPPAIVSADSFASSEGGVPFEYLAQGFTFALEERQGLSLGIRFIDGVPSRADGVWAVDVAEGAVIVSARITSPPSSGVGSVRDIVQSLHKQGSFGESSPLRR